MEHGAVVVVVVVVILVKTVEGIPKYEIIGPCDPLAFIAVADRILKNESTASSPRLTFLSS